MVREVLRDEMALESTPLSAAADHRYQCGCAAALGLSFVQPTVTFLAADKILRNLLRRFPFRDLNSVPVSSFVIDEHMSARDPQLVTLSRESPCCRAGVWPISSICCPPVEAIASSRCDHSKRRGSSYDPEGIWPGTPAVVHTRDAPHAIERPVFGGSQKVDRRQE